MGYFDFNQSLKKSEFETYEVSNLGVEAERLGIKWLHLPIEDRGIPNHEFELSWTQEGKELEAILKNGGKIVLHCLGGLGRTGLVAAKLLVDMGFSAKDAISMVRQARQSTIETDEQERYIYDVWEQKKR